MNRTLFFTTIVALVLGLAMTVLSAQIRLSDSGIDCSPWPECFASSFRVDNEPGISIDQEDPNKSARALHRVLASLFGIVVLFQFSLAAWHRKNLKQGLTVPAIILLLTLLLAIVGMNTPDIIHPVVTLINLSGGMTLSILLYWYLLGFYPVTGGKLPILLTLVAVYAAVITGAWVSGNFAAGACETICQLQGELTEAFSPYRTLELTDQGLLFDNNQSLIVLVHQATAVIAIGLVLYSAFLSGSFSRAGLLLAPALLLIVVAALEHLEHSVWLASAHNHLSLLLLLLLVHQYRRWDAP